MTSKYVPFQRHFFALGVGYTLSQRLPVWGAPFVLGPGLPPQICIGMTPAASLGHALLF